MVGAPGYIRRIRRRRLRADLLMAGVAIFTAAAFFFTLTVAAAEYLGYLR